MIPPEIQNFNFFDICVVLLTCALIIFGYIRGIVKEILSLSSWAASFAITLATREYMDSLLMPHVSQSLIRGFVSSLVPFVFSITFFLILTSVISDKVAETRFNAANKPLGAIFGIIKAGFFVIVFYALALIFDPHKKFESAYEAKVAYVFKGVSEDMMMYIKQNQDSIRKFIEDFFGNFPKVKAKRYDSYKDVREFSTPKISESIIKPSEKESKSIMESLRNKHKKFSDLVHGRQTKTEPIENAGSENEKKEAPKILKGIGKKKVRENVAEELKSTNNVTELKKKMIKDLIDELDTFSE